MRFHAAFKSDTGADVTAVPETLNTQGQLVNAIIILRATGETPLKVQDRFTAIPQKKSSNLSRRLCHGGGVSNVRGLAVTAQQPDLILPDSKETVK